MKTLLAKPIAQGRAILLILGILLAIWIHSSFYVVEVHGPSMLPTIQEGNKVLATNNYAFFGPIKRKDLIVFHYHNEFLIKRVIAASSDGTYIVVGDNRAESLDSRTFGPIWEDQILGKVIRY